MAHAFTKAIAKFVSTLKAFPILKRKIILALEQTLNGPSDFFKKNDDVVHCSWSIRQSSRIHQKRARNWSHTFLLAVNCCSKLFLKMNCWFLLNLASKWRKRSSYELDQLVDRFLSLWLLFPVPFSSHHDVRIIAVGAIRVRLKSLKCPFLTTWAWCMAHSLPLVLRGK